MRERVVFRRNSRDENALGRRLESRMRRNLNNRQIRTPLAAANAAALFDDLIPSRADESRFRASGCGALVLRSLTI